MAQNITLDNIDNQIISELEKDARTPFLEIARKIGVSEGTIRKRVAKLVENSIIRKFTIDIKENYSAIVGIETNPHIPTPEIIKELKNFTTKRIYEVAGRYDLICFLSAKNLENLNEILEKIRIIKGIAHTETFTILKEN